MKWKHFPRNWPFVRGLHRSPVNSPHKGQWRGALMFSLICVWINDWVNNSEAGDLRRYSAHYDVIVMKGQWVRKAFPCHDATMIDINTARLHWIVWGLLRDKYWSIDLFWISNLRQLFQWNICIKWNILFNHDMWKQIAIWSMAFYLTLTNELCKSYGWPGTFVHAGPSGGTAFTVLSVINRSLHTQITKSMGPTWGPSGSCQPQMGPMLAPWILLSG